MVFLILIILINFVHSQDQTCGTDCQWTVENGKLTITGSGPMTDFEPDESPWFSYCRSIEEVVIEKGITTIGNFAFTHFTSLKNIIIPDSVTSIGVYAFDSCTSLKSVTLSDSLTTIYDGAFNNCESLKSVRMGNRVTSIGVNAFDSCTSLTSIILPDSLTTIGQFAFQSCTSLTSIIIPDSVTSIEVYAFNGCSMLKSVVIGNSLETIPENTFRKCTSLTSVTIGTSVKTIGQFAFESCPSLTSIVIPSSVTKIGNNAFDASVSLSNILFLGESEPTCGVDIFNNVQATSVRVLSTYDESKSTFAGKSVERPTNSGTKSKKDCGTKCKWDLFNDGYLVVTGEGEISDFSQGTKAPWFAEGNPAITQIYIHSTITKIGDYSFDGCSSLTSIIIPNSVTTIGNYAFNGWSSLNQITIPNSVTTIGDYAFQSCRTLTKVEYLGTNEPTCESNVFENTGIEYVYVPANYKGDDFCGKKLKSEGSCNSNANDPCKWEYDWEINKLEISGTGEMDGWTSHEEVPWRELSDKMAQVTISEGITLINDYSFSRCSSLTSIEVNSNNQIYSSEEGVLFNKGKTELIKYPIGNTRTEYTIPYSVITIGNNAFESCTSLTSITTGNLIETIGDHAFSGCSSLTQMTIPESVKTIGEGVFNGCTSLEKIEVSTNNPAYSSEDGVLFDKDKTILIHYPSKLVGTEYSIPDSVTTIGNNAFESCTSLTSITTGNLIETIGNYAFSGCSSLTQITIPDSVTTIENNAFESCTSLKYITIPKQVKSIGDYAFKSSHRLTEIVFMGDKEQEITCGSDVFDEITYFEYIKVKNSYQGETFCGKEVEKTNICLELTTPDQSTGDCGCIGNAKVVEKTNGRKCKCEDDYHYVDGECKLKIECGVYTTKYGDETNTEPCVCVNLSEKNKQDVCECVEHAEFEEEYKSCKCEYGYEQYKNECVKIIECGEYTTNPGEYSAKCTCVDHAKYVENGKETKCECDEEVSIPSPSDNSCILKEGYFKNGTEYVKLLQCGKMTTMEGGFSTNCTCVKNAIYEEGKNETQCVCQNNYSWDEKTKECVNGAESIFISFLILIIIMVLF